MENQIDIIKLPYAFLSDHKLGLPELQLLLEKNITEINETLDYIFNNRSYLLVHEKQIVDALIDENESRKREKLDQIFDGDTSNPSLDQIFFIILSYIKDIPLSLDETLSSIDYIYCEFGHPLDLSHFIPYIPEKGLLKGDIKSSEGLKMRIADYLYNKIRHKRVSIS